MTRRILILAYMFPPIVDGGAFRPTSFAKYLPEFGYDPIVLSRPDSGGLPLDEEQIGRLPSVLRVERVPRGFVDGWNEHFRQRFAWTRPFEALLRKPRGWIGDAVAWRVAKRDELRQWEVAWMQPAIELGLKLVERYQPSVLLATGPPFETLKAGCVLHERTGLPLISDFRDPWTYGVLWHPATEARARSEREWEARVVRASSKILVVTPSMQRTMSETYPERASEVELVMNGYEDVTVVNASPPSDRFVLSYVGAVMERRLPKVFFEALRLLRVHHPEAARDVRVQLIGPKYGDASPTDRIRGEKLDDVVTWLGPVSQDRSRQMMRESHVLLHIESTATYAVSGKLFEYLNAGRPVIGMTPAGSDDEWFLNQSGAGQNVGLHDAGAIAEAIYTRWREWQNGGGTVIVDRAWLSQFHRREQTRKLAAVLDQATQGSRTTASAPTRSRS